MNAEDVVTVTDPSRRSCTLALHQGLSLDDARELVRIYVAGLGYPAECV